MKTLIASILLLSASVVSAREFALNPDRFPSLGFNVSNTSLSGHRDEVDMPNPALTRDLGGKLTSNYDAIGADIRLPVSDGVTLTFFGDAVNSDTTFTRSGNIYRQADKLSGYRYGLSMRVYFNK